MAQYKNLQITAANRFSPTMVLLLNLPVYFINGNASPNNVEAWDRHIKNYSVKYIPAVGHYPMLENIELFNKHLQNSVEEILNIQN